MSAVDDAIARELQHPSGTMDDPLTAALAQCQCGDDFWTRRLDPGDERPEDRAARVQREADQAASLPEWFTPAAVAVLALVSAVSWVWPFLWGAR